MKFCKLPSSYVNVASLCLAPLLMADFCPISQLGWPQRWMGTVVDLHLRRVMRVFH